MCVFLSIARWQYADTISPFYFALHSVQIWCAERYMEFVRFVSDIVEIGCKPRQVLKQIIWREDHSEICQSSLPT
jgi:hypothetical protein